MNSFGLICWRVMIQGRLYWLQNSRILAISSCYYWSPFRSEYRWHCWIIENRGRHKILWSAPHLKYGDWLREVQLSRNPVLLQIWSGYIQFIAWLIPLSNWRPRKLHLWNNKKGKGSSIFMEMIWDSPTYLWSLITPNWLPSSHS